MSTIKKDTMFTNFWSKRYYKNLFLGTGASYLILAFWLLICAIWPKGEPFEGNRWITFAPAVICAMGATWFGQYFWNVYQQIKYNEEPDDREIYWCFGGIFLAFPLSVITMLLITKYPLFKQFGIIAIEGGVFIGLAFLVHLGKLILKKK